MTYDPRESWTSDIVQNLEDHDYSTYPAQGLIRILKGRYPHLPSVPLSGTAIDVGCGDGRNAMLLRDLGYTVTGYEITSEICTKLAERTYGVSFEVGASHGLPLADSTCDLSVSWHAGYYMGLHNGTFESHIAELARVTREGGALVISIPMPSCFIFQDSDIAESRADATAGVLYRTIRQDPFAHRIGETLATCTDKDAFRELLARHFQRDVAVGEEMGDWFGMRYDWWDAVAIK